MLNTRHPVFIFWGVNAICLYNDGYKQTIGPERDAIALGNPGAVVWAEIWDVIGPQVGQVLTGGEATWYENHLIPVTRHGERQEAYWTYSYSPIDDEQSSTGIGGALVLVSETLRAFCFSSANIQKWRACAPSSTNCLALSRLWPVPSSYSNMSTTPM